MARPTTYTEEMGKRICDAVAASQDGLRKTLDSDPELPAFGTVVQWRQNISSFASSYARAKQQQVDAMAEDIVDISRDDTLDPNDKRIRIDTLKWLLAKLIPRTYGDKLDVTSGGEALAPASHQIDARVQSIVMQARLRKEAHLTGLDAQAQALLE